MWAGRGVKGISLSETEKREGEGVVAIFGVAVGGLGREGDFGQGRHEYRRAGADIG